MEDYSRSCIIRDSLGTGASGNFRTIYGLVIDIIIFILHIIYYFGELKLDFLQLISLHETYFEEYFHVGLCPSFDVVDVNAVTVHCHMKNDPIGCSAWDQTSCVQVHSL